MGLTGRPGSPRLPSVPSGPGAPVGPGGPGEPCRGDKGSSNQFLSHALVGQRPTNSLLLQEIHLFPSLPSPLWGREDQLDHPDLHYLADPVHKLSSQDAHTSPHISLNTHLSALLHIPPPTSLSTLISTQSFRFTAHPSPHISLNTHLSALLHIPPPTSLSTHISPLYCTHLNTHLSMHISAPSSSTPSLVHGDNSLFFPWFHLFREWQEYLEAQFFLEHPVCLRRRRRKRRRKRRRRRGNTCVPHMINVV